MKPQSRAIMRKINDSEDLYEILIVCEKTKQQIPIYGIEKNGGLKLAGLLVSLGEAGMELPKFIIDEDAV